MQGETNQLEFRWHKLQHTTNIKFRVCQYIWAGHVARMGEDKGVHRVLVGKSEGKRPLGETKM